MKLARLLPLLIAASTSACATTSTATYVALPNPRVRNVNLFELEPPIAAEPVDDAPQLALETMTTPAVNDTVDSAPELHEPAAGDSGVPAPVVDLGTVPAGTANASTAIAVAAIASVTTREPEVPPEPPEPPAYTYQLLAGEMLDQAIARWAAHDGFSVEYRAAFHIPVPRDVTLEATSLREAVTLALTPLWGSRFALIAEQSPDKTLVVRTP